jgi:hypothetical protein
MSDHLQYALNSGAWFLGGCGVSSIYWRTIVHRKLVKAGQAKKEQPLSLFVALLVGLSSIMGLLFSQSARLALQDYVHCQARVNQRNVETINDRTKSAADQLNAENTFYEALLKIFSSAPSASNRDVVIQRLNEQIAQNNKRVTSLLNSPLQPVTDCKPPKTGAGG